MQTIFLCLPLLVLTVALLILCADLYSGLTVYITEYDTGRGILKFQCETWKFCAFSKQSGYYTLNMLNPLKFKRFQKVLMFMLYFKLSYDLASEGVITSCIKNDNQLVD